MLKSARLLAVLGLALLAGYAAAQDKKPAFTQASEDAPMVHVLSGFSFPARIGSFQRDSSFVYNEAGDDVSVGYHENAARIVATLYVYPTHGSTLAKELAMRENEVSQVHPDAQLISSGNVAVTPKQNKALFASFTFVADFAGTQQKLLSDLVVAQMGDWFVEYRMSYPAESGDMAQPKLKLLLQTFAWP